MGTYSVTDISNMTSGLKSKLINPKVTISYVQSGDVDGVNYVTGSAGQVKQLKEYSDVAKTQLISTTTFKYEDTTYSTKVTDIEVV